MGVKALQILLATVIRNGLLVAISYLIKYHFIDATTLSPADIAELVALIITGLGVLWWAFYSRIQSHFAQIVALRMPSSATIADVNRVAANTAVADKISATNTNP